VLTRELVSGEDVVSASYIRPKRGKKRGADPYVAESIPLTNVPSFPRIAAEMF
jgi:hypothetical protein